MTPVTDTVTDIPASRRSCVTSIAKYSHAPDAMVTWLGLDHCLGTRIWAGTHMRKHTRTNSLKLTTITNTQKKHTHARMHARTRTFTTCHTLSNLDK